jgi:hypothetical protein
MNLGARRQSHIKIETPKKYHFGALNSFLDNKLLETE